MIAAPPGVRVYLACGTAVARMAGLAMQVQQVLAHNPFDVVMWCSPSEAEALA